LNTLLIATLNLAKPGGESRCERAVSSREVAAARGPPDARHARAAAAGRPTGTTRVTARPGARAAARTTGAQLPLVRQLAREHEPATTLARAHSGARARAPECAPHRTPRRAATARARAHPRRARRPRGEPEPACGLREKGREEVPVTCRVPEHAITEFRELSARLSARCAHSF